MSFCLRKAAILKKSPVVPLYSTELAMVPKLILKASKILLENVGFEEYLGVQADPPYTPH